MSNNFIQQNYVEFIAHFYTSLLYLLLINLKKRRNYFLTKNARKGKSWLFGEINRQFFCFNRIFLSCIKTKEDRIVSCALWHGYFKFVDFVYPIFICAANLRFSLF